MKKMSLIAGYQRLACFLGACLMFSLTAEANKAEDCVVLLHGLASSKYVFKPMEYAFDIQPEFRTVNIGYNSFKDQIPVLARNLIPKAIDRCELQEDEQVHFVVHSMGGLILRAYLSELSLSEQSIPQLGKAVMIATPNGGSEWVDRLDQYGGLSYFLGPAGQQLKTTEDSYLANLPDRPDIEFGVIAGTTDSRPIGGWVLPGQHDGKVAVSKTWLRGMADFALVEASHTALLYSKRTIEHSISFLRYGYFDHRAEDPQLIDREGFPLKETSEN